MMLPATLGGRRRGHFMRLTLNAAAQSALLLVTAVLVRYTFDHLLIHSFVRWRSLLLMGSAMIAAAATNGWLQYRERIIAESLGQSYVHSLRRKLFLQTTRMSPQQLQNRRNGAVMLKFIGDLNAIRRWISLGLVRLVVSGAIVTSTVVVLSQIDWLLGFITMVIIVGGTMANIRNGASLRRAAVDVRRHRASLSANINEKISQMTVVQVFGGSRKEIDRVRRQSGRLRRSLLHRAGKIGLARGINYGMTASMTTAILMAGTMRVNSGNTTAGAVAAAIAVMGFMAPALRSLGRIYEYHQEASVARQKLAGFLSMRTPIKQGSRRPDLRDGPGKLAFRNVAVEGRIEKFTESIAPGCKVALIGPNGAGKSTLLALVARMVELHRGRILMDGQNIAAVSLASVRKAVGIVGPDLPLLAGTIEKNIRYRCPECPPAEVQRVKTLCRIDNMVRDLPDGWQTPVHEGGRNLSAGQRQRIMLARALLGAPRFLLLDEVDSHMDDEARDLLIHVIRSYPGTVLWASHQALPVDGVDTVWCIENGKISIAPAPRQKLWAVV